MELKKLIGVDDNKESILILGVIRNTINFYGSNLTATATTGKKDLSSFSLLSPQYLRQGIIALAITERDGRGEATQQHYDFLHIIHDGEGRIYYDLEHAYKPPAQRMAHVEDGGIVAIVAGKRVASFNKENHLLADGNKICSWIMEEISDEELLDSTTDCDEGKYNEQQFEKLIAHVETLEADNEMLLQRVDELSSKNSALKILNINLKNECTDNANRLEVAKVAINEIYEKSLDVWFVPKKLMACIKKCRTMEYLWPKEKK